MIDASVAVLVAASASGANGSMLIAWTTNTSLSRGLSCKSIRSCVNVFAALSVTEKPIVITELLCLSAISLPNKISLLNIAAQHRATNLLDSPRWGQIGIRGNLGRGAYGYGYGLGVGNGHVPYVLYTVFTMAYVK